VARRLGDVDNSGRGPRPAGRGYQHVAALRGEQHDRDRHGHQAHVAEEPATPGHNRRNDRPGNLRTRERKWRPRSCGTRHGLGDTCQAAASGRTPAFVAHELAAFVAEAEALHERLVRLVVHLGKELPAGRVVSGAHALVVAEESPEAYRERAELAGDAQLPTRRRQHEPGLAALARVLNERGTFLGGAQSTMPRPTATGSRRTCDTTGSCAVKVVRKRPRRNGTVVRRVLSSEPACSSTSLVAPSNQEVRA
jgi:hypothetical protein